jgi:chromatin assembly factor 1 subunit B
MKAAPLLVAWHEENAPIYSAHFEPHGKGRLATAGGDSNVRVRLPSYLDRPMQNADQL